MVLLAVLGVLQAPITFHSLVADTIDLDRLYGKTASAYRAAQASSYDRASTTADKGESWFANADAGQFIRTENHDGRMEYVMADLKGPGVITRIWSANPTARVRFYFDGSERPLISEKLADLLSGKVAPFGDPFAYVSARGWNLYAPIPYAESLKITVDDTDENGAKHLYYHVGYRTYPTGTVVQTYSPGDAAGAKAELDKAAAVLKNPDALVAPSAFDLRRTTLLPAGQETSLIENEGSGTIRELRFQILDVDGKPESEYANLPWTDPHRIHNILRNLVLVIRCDKVSTVRVPLADFFLVAGGMNTYQTLPLEVTADGILICRFPMPFKSMFQLSLVNFSELPVLIHSAARLGPKPKADDFYYFYSQWIPEKDSTRPMRDMECLNVKGEGRLVGTAMHVGNPTPAWWGEGDEKIFIDGEPFPSFFGTGTEDFYGYAWCDPTPFARPYNAQPRADGPGNRGHTEVARFFILDPIPFTKTIQFNLEMWHWAEVTACYDRTTYWYANLRHAAPRPFDLTLLKLTDYPKPKPVEGAIEGENLKVVVHQGGEIEKQGGFWELSGERQLWWHHPKPGDKLAVEIPVPTDGKYELIGSFCENRDYGIHKLKLNGKDVATVDFFSNDLRWSKKSLGIFNLKAGAARLDVECVGKRQGALDGNMFGIDYFLLVKK